MGGYLGSDHAGYELKAHLATHLTAAGDEEDGGGPHAYAPEDDYPKFCIETGERVVADTGSLGVVIGGSGNGEQIAANKVVGGRAALAWNTDTSRLATEHNDANIVAIGARQHSLDVATSFVDTFLATPFSQDPRHARRIAQVAGYELRAT